MYTYASRGQEVVFVNARIAAVGEVQRQDEGAREAAASGACSPRGPAAGVFRRLARCSGLRARRSLRPGHTLTGPAIIEAETTTVLVDIGDRVTRQSVGLVGYFATVMLVARMSGAISGILAYSSPAYRMRSCGLRPTRCIHFILITKSLPRYHRGRWVASRALLTAWRSRLH